MGRVGRQTWLPVIASLLVIPQACTDEPKEDLRADGRIEASTVANSVPVYDPEALKDGVVWTLDPAGPTLTRIAGLQVRALVVTYLDGSRQVVVAMPRRNPVCFRVAGIAGRWPDAPADSVVVRLPGGIVSVHRMLVVSDSSVIVQDRRTGEFAELTCASTSLSSGRVEPRVPGAEAWPILGKDASGRLLLAPRTEVRREGSAAQWIRRVLMRAAPDSLIRLGEIRAERYLDVDGGMRPPPPLAARFSMEARGTEARILSPGAPDTIYRLEEGRPVPFFSVDADVRRPTTPADRRAWIAEELAGLGAAARGPSELMLEGLSFPDRLPSLVHVRLGSDGTTWARIWDADAPKRELWAAFDAARGFLGSVRTSEGVRILAFGEAVVVAAVPAGDGWILRHLRLVPTDR